MKRLVFLNCLLISIFLYVSHSICDENIVVPRKILPEPSLQSSKKQYRREDGFCGNTLVKTPFGYKAIKNLNEGDIVIGSKDRKKRIVAITKHYVGRCIKLIVDGTIIYTGYDQFYYKIPFSMFNRAHAIKAGDMLRNDTHEGCSVQYVELINQRTLLYYLTVEDHIFCIAPHDVCVHNAEPLVLGLSSICLGTITVVNPIIATVGATIALSTIAHKTYQAHMQQYTSDDMNYVRPTHVILAERSYYFQRFTALEGIRQELLCIKNGLENLKSVYDVGAVSFTYQFLKQTIPSDVRQQNQLLQISSTREMQLSDNQKENLRILREAELKHIEQEIVDLQVVLACHVNELIEQIYAADIEYKNLRDELARFAIVWNDNCYKMTDAIAFDSYKAHLLEDSLLQNFSQKVNELKIVAHYYNNCIKTVCIRQSTNIFDLLEKMNSTIAEYDQQIAKDKARIAQNILVSEQYFVRRRIIIEHIKNEIKTYSQKNRNSRNAQAIAEAKSKLESIVVAGSPQNNNNKKDDESEKDFNNQRRSFNTAQEATEAAEKLGFEKTNYHSKGQPVFKQGNRYISPDVTSHNGGVWKMADSVKNLGSRTTRMGTYDAYLNRIGN